MKHDPIRRRRAMRFAIVDDFLPQRLPDMRDQRQFPQCRRIGSASIRQRDFRSVNHHPTVL